jgi:hypothetical protein
MKLICLAFLALSFLIPTHSFAGTRVDVLPRKIVLDDKVRSADVTIMNLGEKTGTVRMELISYSQDGTGTYKILDAPLNPLFDPQKVVRFSPRQFTLPPGGRQKIRLSIQRPADLPDGEYRFHVKATSYDSQESLEGKPVPTKGKSIGVAMNIAVAIPVVVRKGALTTGAKMENISLLAASENEYNKPALKFDILRTGQAGTMGVVTAFWDAAGQEPVEIGRVSNVNIFSEVPKRTMILPLKEIPKGSGNIRVVYTNDFGDKGVFDEVALQN